MTGGLADVAQHFAGAVAADATLFDPACGIGTLLLAVGPERGPTRCGQESDARSARFAQLRQRRSHAT